MRTFLADFLVRKNALKKSWKSLWLFSGHEEFVDLIDDLGIELKSVLLFAYIDRLTKEAKCLPKFFGDVIFELGRQEVSENTLKLVQNRFFFGLFIVTQYCITFKQINKKKARWGENSKCRCLFVLTESRNIVELL